MAVWHLDPYCYSSEGVVGGTTVWSPLAAGVVSCKIVGSALIGLYKGFDLFGLCEGLFRGPHFGSVGLLCSWVCLAGGPRMFSPAG